MQDPDLILSSPPLDDDLSIVTVQTNPERLFLNDGDNDEIDYITESDDHHHLQTIVEVVNPVIFGDGDANEIVTSGGPESLEENLYSGNSTQSSETFRKKPELSLNAKMKNVLQELVENERVKLRLSQSIDDDEEDDDEDDDDDEEEDDDDYEDNLDKNQTTSFYDSYYDNINAGSFVDGCQVYQNPNTENLLNTTTAVEKNEKASVEEGVEEVFSDSMLSEIDVTNSKVVDEEKKDVGDETDKIEAGSLLLDNNAKDTVEDVEEDETTNGLTTNEDTVLEHQHQQMSSSNKSGISNNKKKKRKNKNKRK